MGRDTKQTCEWHYDGEESCDSVLTLPSFPTSSGKKKCGSSECSLRNPEQHYGRCSVDLVCAEYLEQKCYDQMGGRSCRWIPRHLFTDLDRLSRPIMHMARVLRRSACSVRVCFQNCTSVSLLKVCVFRQLKSHPDIYVSWR